MTTHSTTPGYLGGLVTGRVRPAVTLKNDEDALLIDNLVRATFGGDSMAIDAARMALRQRMNELRTAGVAVPAYTHADVAAAHTEGYKLGLAQKDRPC